MLGAPKHGPADASRQGGASSRGASAATEMEGNLHQASRDLTSAQVPEAPATDGGSIAASIAYFEALARYRDAQRLLTSAQRLLTSSITTAWAETCFATLCLRGLFDLRWLMRARGVSQAECRRHTHSVWAQHNSPRGSARHHTQIHGKGSRQGLLSLERRRCGAGAAQAAPAAHAGGRTVAIFRQRSLLWLGSLVQTDNGAQAV